MRTAPHRFSEFPDMKFMTFREAWESLHEGDRYLLRRDGVGVLGPTYARFIMSERDRDGDPLALGFREMPTGWLDGPFRPDQWDSLIALSRTRIQPPQNELPKGWHWPVTCELYFEVNQVRDFTKQPGRPPVPWRVLAEQEFSQPKYTFKQLSEHQWEAVETERTDLIGDLASALRWNGISFEVKGAKAVIGGEEISLKSVKDALTKMVKSKGPGD